MFGNCAGSFARTFFFSLPTMLVQSVIPLSVPSAFFFFHTLKLTPQLLMASMTSCRCLFSLSDGALLRFSLVSRSISLLIRFLSKISEETKRNMVIQGLSVIKSTVFFFGGGGIPRTPRPFSIHTLFSTPPPPPSTFNSFLCI